MRVLYVNSNLARPHTAPGIWGKKVLAELRAAGADVRTVPAIPRADRSHDGKPGRGRSLRQLAGRLLPTRGAARLLEYYLITRGLYRSLRAAGHIWLCRGSLDVDVVLGRHVEYECSANLAARILRLPLVMEVHSPTFMDRQARGQPASRVVEAVERRMWARCAAIWVNSANLKSIVTDAGVSAERVHTIPFGVAINPYCAERSRGAGEGVNVVFVGSFYPWHGVTVLLRAFAAARETAGSLHLTLIGDGDERANCEHLVRDLGLTPAVTFAGRLPNDEVFARLAGADIGVAPYTPDERFYYDPAKILEYLASGLAVVASDQGRISEMLDNGKCGVLVPPGDPTALRDALILLAGNRELRQAMGQAGRERATAHHSWAGVASKVLAVLENAIEREGAGRPRDWLQRRPVPERVR